MTDADTRAIVLHLVNRTRIVLWVVAVAVIAGLALGYVVLSRQAEQAKDTEKLAESNREAIRVSCTLLANAIVESGAGGNNRRAASPAVRAQREITSILVAAIGREILTPRERARIAELSKIVAAAGGAVTIPNCNAISRHPDRVRELLLGPSPARRARP